MNMKRKMRGGQHRNQRGGGGMNMRRPGGGGGQHRGSASHFNIVPDRRNLRKAQEAKEKYLNMAKDAMTYGDRVTAEYYYQHADHYHRVMHAIEEEIAEFERNRPQRPQHDGANPSAEGSDAAQEGETLPDDAGAAHDDEPSSEGAADTDPSQTA